MLAFFQPFCKEPQSRDTADVTAAADAMTQIQQALTGCGCREITVRGDAALLPICNIS
jgi:hypothetical protein